jgi:hypothetical protein
MAKGDKRGGRTTPKGTRSDVRTGTPSGRYTPPIPREEKVSPTWVPVVMFGCLAIGVLVIILNYLNLLPGDASNGYLLVGLGLITAGFITATQYH